jgi:DNA-binding MarR family transcriptional regulator
MQVVLEPRRGSPELRSLAATLHRALTDFVRQYQFRNRDELCCYGVTVSQCYLLETLGEQGPLSMQALSSHLGLAVSSVTRAVAGLVRKKLVQRRRDPADLRVVQVELSESGRRVLGKIREDLLQREEELLEALPPELRENVVSAVVALLERVSPQGRKLACG